MGEEKCFRNASHGNNKGLGDGCVVRHTSFSALGRELVSPFQ